MAAKSKVALDETWYIGIFFNIQFGFDNQKEIKLPLKKYMWNGDQMAILTNHNDKNVEDTKLLGDYYYGQM